MIEELRERIDPSTWSPAKRYKARKMARKLLELLRARGLDAQALAKAQAALADSGLLGDGD